MDFSTLEIVGIQYVRTVRSAHPVESELTCVQEMRRETSPVAILRRGDVTCAYVRDHISRSRRRPAFSVKNIDFADRIGRIEIGTFARVLSKEVSRFRRSP